MDPGPGPTSYVLPFGAGYTFSVAWHPTKKQQARCRGRRQCAQPGIAWLLDGARRAPAGDVEDPKASTLLGRGGLGIVVRGSFSGSVAAIKRSSCPSSDAELQREAQFLKKLDPHPHIVRLRYFPEDWGPAGSGQGRPEMVVELLGPSLEQVMKMKQVRTRDVLRVASSVFAGLSRCEQCLIAHTDVKPANLCVRPD